MTVVTYALEQLFVDQDRDWVIETIAPVLAWVPGKSRSKQQPFRFDIEHKQNKASRTVSVDLAWDEAKLEHLAPGVKDTALPFARVAALCASRSRSLPHTG